MSHLSASVSGPTMVTSEGSSSQIRRDRKFWFEDGTISVIAGSVEFRVYKGLLARQSLVFADMFSFPQPEPGRSEDGAPSADAAKVPIVHVTDSSHAFRNLLAAAGMAPGEKALTFDAIHPTCFTLASCIRLGQKYQIPQIVDPCLRYLERYLPTTLEQYDALETLLPPGFGTKLSTAICLVNLARLTGATDMLPLLLMICSNLPGNEVVAGFKGPDGFIDTLSPSDLARCYNAQSQLIRAHNRSMGLRITSLPSSKCTHVTKCKLATHSLLVDTMTNVTRDPLSELETAGGLDAARNLCSICRAMLKRYDEAERRRMWSQLPELVGLGPIKGWGQKRGSGSTHVASR